MLIFLFVSDQKKDSNKKIIVILVVVGLVILSVCAFFSWKWIAKHRGNVSTVCSLILVIMCQLSLSMCLLVN